MGLPGIPQMCKCKKTCSYLDSWSCFCWQTRIILDKKRNPKESRPQRWMGYARATSTIGNPSCRRAMYFPRNLVHLHIVIEQQMTVSHQDARNLGLLTVVGKQNACTKLSSAKKSLSLRLLSTKGKTTQWDQPPRSSTFRLTGCSGLPHNSRTSLRRRWLTI